MFGFLFETCTRGRAWKNSEASAVIGAECFGGTAFHGERRATKLQARGDRSCLRKLNSRDPQSMRRAVLYSACHSSAVPSSSPLLLGHLLPAVATSSPLSAPPPPPAFSVSAPPPPPDSRAGRGPPPPLGGDLIPQLWDPPPCLRAYLPPGGVRRRSKKLQKFKRGEEVTL